MMSNALPVAKTLAQALRGSVDSVNLRGLPRPESMRMLKSVASDPVLVATESILNIAPDIESTVSSRQSGFGQGWNPDSFGQLRRADSSYGNSSSDDDSRDDVAAALRLVPDSAMEFKPGMLLSLDSIDHDASPTKTLAQRRDRLVPGSTDASTRSHGRAHATPVCREQLGW